MLFGLRDCRFFFVFKRENEKCVKYICICSVRLYISVNNVKRKCFFYFLIDF